MRPFHQRRHFALWSRLRTSKTIEQIQQGREQEKGVMKGVRRLVQSRLIIPVTALIYLGSVYYYMREQEDQKLQLAASRSISRVTGYLCNMPLPPYVRVGIYTAFGKTYGVNFDEMKQKDLNKFRTFNDFFTREIDPSIR